jgi:hypothetical protein
MSGMEEHWLTVDQLLALAAAEGFQPPEITARKIERWRKAGLLPRPRRIRLGRRGTRSEYPPETGRQLLALCRLRRWFPHDLDAIRFGLWYERYRIPIDDVKRSMEQLLNPLLRQLPLDSSDPLATAEQHASHMQSKPLRSSSGRRLKQLRNADEMNMVLTAMFQLMLGDVPGFTAHAEEELGERPLVELFIDVLGLNRAQTDRIGEVKPWLPQDNSQLARDFEDMAMGQFLSLPAQLQTLKGANAKQLAQARNDLTRLLVGLKQAAKAIEALLGPNAFGFGLFSELPGDPDFRVLALLFLVRLRATSYSTGMDEIEAALLNAKPDYQRMVTFLKALHQEHPAIAEEILTQTRELDFSDSHALDRFHTIFAAAHVDHPEELQAFFQQHPELIPPDAGM